MIRTQIQLTEEQAKLLKELAASRGQSVAQLIRESVDSLSGRPFADADVRRQRALAAIGRFRSGRHDVSARHGDHLAEVWQK